MHRSKLFGLALLALLVLGVVASASYAVEPQILVLTGKISELQATLKSTGTAQLINLTGEKTIEAKGAEVKLKGCEGTGTDTNLCNNVPITFTGVKQVGGPACRSEDKNGNKDPVETVLALLDLHLSSEKATKGELQALLLARVLGLGKEVEEEVKFVCGLLKIKVTGVVACLLVTKESGAAVEVKCSVNASHDKEIGTCEVLCDEFGKVLGLTGEYGSEKLDAWESITLEGKPSSDIVVDV
jgi:hypothetical protein